jgi:hypothetical protein
MKGGVMLDRLFLEVVPRAVLCMVFSLTVWWNFVFPLTPKVRETMMTNKELVQIFFSTIWRVVPLSLLFLALPLGMGLRVLRLGARDAAVIQRGLYWDIVLTSVLVSAIMTWLLTKAINKHAMKSRRAKC